MKKYFCFISLIVLVIMLSGCSWRNYEGCALYPTDTEPDYQYVDPVNHIGKYNSTQKWWEYKKNEFGFFNYSQRSYRGNTPWWSYPVAIVADPIQIGEMIVLCLMGEEMP